MLRCDLLNGLVTAQRLKRNLGFKLICKVPPLRQLHSYGLLRGSFRPDAEIATLLADMHQRERLTEYAAAHIQHMQKALMEMNLQLHHVVSGITGATGMRIIRAIVVGERDPEVLAAFRDIRCKSSIDTIKAALVGNDRGEHVFALTQSLELYDFYKARIEDCDGKLEAAVAALTIKARGKLAPLPKARIKGKQHNAPAFDVRAALYGVLGMDLTQIHGLGPSLVLKLIAECGTDLRAWKSAKHFTSWLCLAPGNKISGGKLLSSRTRRSSSRAAALLRLAATTIGRSDTALGAFYRRLSSRIGKQKAVTATARKIAVLFYNAIRDGMTYQDQGAAAYDERHRQRVLTNLRRRARTLGYSLAPGPRKRLFLRKSPRISPGMQSEIRVRGRASRTVLCAGDVPMPAHPAKRLLHLAEDPAEQAGAGGQAPDRADPESMGRER